MRHFRSLCFALGLTAAAGASLANTYTVTSTADSGAGTLRQAILDANANPGADTIAFNVTGSGVHTISPTSALPPITGPVAIDGYTQPGSSANTNPTGQGLNTALRVEINGTNAGSAACLSVQADDVTIRGLAINRCTGQAIEAITASHQNLVVEGCFIGSNADGTQALTPYGGAISLGNHQNARIGGTTAAARNLISGAGINNQITIGNFFAPNSGHLIQGNLIGTDASGTVKISTTADSSVGIFAGTGIIIGGVNAAARNVVVNRIILGPGGNGTFATGNFALGNFIGTDVTGLVPLGCNGYCISANHQSNTIGGTAAGAGNVIAGATGAAGIEIRGDGTVVQGNFVGTDPTETARLGNAPWGIYGFANGVTIGGTGPGEGNVIAHNGPPPGSALPGAGVLVEGQAVSIRGNSIYDTGGTAGTGIGIDLRSNNAYGITLNDPGDADAGPNGLQNFPVVGAVTYGASTTTVGGSLDSTASTVFDLDFYSTACLLRPQEIAEGQTYLGSVQVATDGSGHAAFSAVLPIAVPVGSSITATATDPSGNTSEFSPRFVLSMTPGFGPTTGFVGAQIEGPAFEAGATVTIGGVAATGIVVNDDHTITANVPALPAGSINAVVVQNPSGGSGTLPNGWIAYFNDEPPAGQFFAQVMKLVVNGITAGVGSGNYGVGSPTLRQQMAVFLLKAKHGTCFAPPPCTGVFADVTCPSGFADWIEALAAEGITGGCGSGHYCPGSPVLRQQMAVFLLKAKHGSSYTPPACQGLFDDVPCSSSFSPWIEELAAEGITGGCGGGNYCPLNNVTRGQMAAFLVNTFSLP
jgi:hypothetical protein